MKERKTLFFCAIRRSSPSASASPLGSWGCSGCLSRMPGGTVLSTGWSRDDRRSARGGGATSASLGPMWRGMKLAVAIAGEEGREGGGADGDSDETGTVLMRRRIVV